MVIVSLEALKKFKKICKERMGIELDDVIAQDQASRLLSLIALTRRPIPKSNRDKLE